MSNTVILLLILGGILFSIEVANIIWYNRHRIKYEKNRFLEKFKRKNNKPIQFD